MEYDKEFEEWLKKNYSYLVDREETRVRFYQCWQAARKDHYRIGEEVESYGSDGWKLSVITATREEIGFTEYPVFVRKIPLKSRIDEIAEEAASHWEGGREALEKAIKSAILQARNEWEAER